MVIIVRVVDDEGLNETFSFLDRKKRMGFRNILQEEASREAAVDRTFLCTENYYYGKSKD